MSFLRYGALQLDENRFFFRLRESRKMGFVIFSTLKGPNSAILPGKKPKFCILGYLLPNVSICTPIDRIPFRSPVKITQSRQFVQPKMFFGIFLLWGNPVPTLEVLWIPNFIDIACWWWSIPISNYDPSDALIRKWHGPKFGSLLARAQPLRGGAQLFGILCIHMLGTPQLSTRGCSEPIQL